MSKIMAMAGTTLNWTCNCGWSYDYTMAESAIIESNEVPAEFEMHVLTEGHYTIGNV